MHQVLERIACFLLCLVAALALVGWEEAQACKVLSSPRAEFTPPSIQPEDLPIIGSMAVSFERGRFSLTPCADMARLTLDPKLEPQRGEPVFMALYVASGWVDGIEHATVQPGEKSAFIYEGRDIESAWPDGDSPTFLQSGQQVSLIAIFFDHSGQVIGRTPEFVVTGPRFFERAISAATWIVPLFGLVALGWIVQNLLSWKRARRDGAQRNR
jgi:hypothetical protein